MKSATPHSRTRLLACVVGGGSLLLGCVVESGENGDDNGSSVRRCAGDDGSLELPPGFCATIFAEDLDNREPGSPGVDPCPELAIRAGIWRFAPSDVQRIAGDGERLASGIRNAVALAVEPTTGALVTVSNGRDQLHDVVLAPFVGGRPTGDHETFATGFAGDARPLPEEAEHRPVGLAEAADGSLYIGDDQGGRIWRVYYDEGTTL